MTLLSSPWPSFSVSIRVIAAKAIITYTILPRPCYPYTAYLIGGKPTDRSRQLGLYLVSIYRPILDYIISAPFLGSIILLSPRLPSLRHSLFVSVDSAFIIGWLFVGEN